MDSVLYKLYILSLGSFCIFRFIVWGYYFIRIYLNKKIKKSIQKYQSIAWCIKQTSLQSKRHSFCSCITTLIYLSDFELPTSTSSLSTIITSCLVSYWVDSALTNFWYLTLTIIEPIITKLIPTISTNLGLLSSTSTNFGTC